MITIFVGDIRKYLCIEAQKLDPLASRINESNYKNLNAGTYYTGLGDFKDLKSFINALNQADTLIYCPPGKWSHEQCQLWAEFYLLYFRDKKKVIGLEKILKRDINFKPVDQRKTELPQLWIVGCSISHGVGVELDQRYGELLSKKLNMDVSFLTASGSSIEWAADQILQSDIRANDIVVWGLTSFGRFVYYTNDSPAHVNVSYYDYNQSFYNIVNPDLLDSDFIMYKALTHIHQVINYCNKIKCKLLIAGLLIDSTDIYYTKEIPNYTQLYGFFGQDEDHTYIDLGNDDAHPGPLTHYWYAEQIANKL